MVERRTLGGKVSGSSPTALNGLTAGENVKRLCIIPLNSANQRQTWQRPCRSSRRHVRKVVHSYLCFLFTLFSCLSFCLSLSVCLSLSLSLPFWLSLSLSFCFSLCVSLCVSHCLCVSISPPPPPPVPPCSFPPYSSYC